MCWLIYFSLKSDDSYGATLVSLPFITGLGGLVDHIRLLICEQNRTPFYLKIAMRFISKESVRFRFN